jgi:cellulose synthase/poly-beta-1,6-N-acetylglucosamine synthase-like glycosyltransferase
MSAGALTLLILALLFFTYAGYPIVIGVLAARSRRGAAPASPANPPFISICLPVYNGGAYVRPKLESLLAQDYPADRFEILIYCDGCTDDTEATARAIAATPEAAGRIRVIAETGRTGKPRGLNTLVPQAKGELLLLNDIRQPLSRNAVRALAATLDDPSVGCATGNLLLAGAAGPGVYWRYENWIRLQESRFRGMVGMTGPIAMVRRADMQPLPEDLILDDLWIPMQLLLAGKRTAFVAEAEAHDAAFENEREFKRKVRTLAGNYQLYARLPQLLVPFTNPLWFETISHKILRLVAPWLLLALAVITAQGAAAGDGRMTVLLVGQTGFYLAAVAGRRGGKIASLARTFVVLNWAAIVGLWRYLTGRQRVTW